MIQKCFMSRRFFGGNIMPFKAYDFNAPLMDNRDEIIFVKMYGGIKNASECLFYNILSKHTAMALNKYPGLMEILGYKDAKKIYDYTNHFTMLKFLKKMREPKSALEDAEICNDIATVMSTADPAVASVTSLEIALAHIKDFDFFKKLYLCDIGGQTKEYADFARNLFGTKSEKVYVLEKSFREMMDEFPEITTAYTDDADELMKYLEYCEGIKEFDKPKDKQFFVMADPSWVKNKDDKFELLYADYFNEATKRFGCQVTWINSHHIDTHDFNPGVRL